MSSHRPITPSTPRSPTRSRTPLSPRGSPRSPLLRTQSQSRPPLEELLASALSHHEKKPSRVAPDAHRPAVAGSDADILSPVPISGKHHFLFESEEALKKNEREEELREQIRQLELLSPEAAKRKATAWARLNDGGDLQYAKMTRPHANPLWVVPPSSIDELADDEGDAWIQQAMQNQKRHFNDSLHPQLQVRLSALQGEFNTRNPEGLFLANIEEMGAGGKKERDYDPLHGNPVSRRATWSRQSFGNSRNTSAATSRAASRATTPGSSSVAAAKRASSADAKVRRSQSIQKDRPLNIASKLSEPPKPSGREFELIPQVPHMSDKALVAAVFDETIGSSDEEEDKPDTSSADSAAPLSDKFIPPPPLLFSGISVTDSFTPPDMVSTPIRLHERSIIPHSLIVADQPKPSAPPPPAKVGVVIGDQVGSVSLFKRSSIKHSIKKPRISTATSNDTDSAAPTTTTDSSKPSRPTSVSWANPTPVGETAVSTLARKNSQEEQKQPSLNSNNVVSAHRPHTADPSSFQSRAPPSRAPSAATTTDGRYLESAATARSPSSNGTRRPPTGGSKSARSRPSSSNGYIIPSGLTSFGYTDRELTTSGETTLDRFCSGSSAQPLDIISRPAGSRNDSGGSTGLLNRGCAVRYRATPSDHHDLLSEKMADTLSTGMTKMLDVKTFRREVELLTNNKQVSNTALKSMLNEKSTSDRIALLRREAKHRKNLEAGGVGTVTQPLPSNGLTHRLYNTAPSARNSIPLRYTKLAGTNIEHINAPSFGEPESNPFRLDPSAASRELPYPRPGSGPYLGPGAYYPNSDFGRPTAKEGYWYGPSHSNWIKRAELDKTDDGPGMHRPKYEVLGTEIPPRGLVEISRGTSRGAWDFIGPHADMNNPPPLAYKTGEKHWSEIVKSRHTNFGFGVSKRFDDRAYKLPSGSKDYINPHPERMLVLAGPRDGPGALHEVIPSRTGANNTYDPNVDAYLHSRGIPPIEVCAQYLSPEELSRTAAEGGSEDGAASTAAAVAHTAFVPLTRAQEREARELDDLLAGALAGAKIEPTKLVEFIPVSLPISSTSANAITEVPVIDPLTLPTAEPPTLTEQRARAALFTSPLTQRTIRTVDTAPSKDFQEHNKQLLRAHSPLSKRVALKSKAKSNKQRRLLVIERGKKTLNQRVSRMREKIAADDEALAARTSGGLFNNRWMLLAALCSRTAYIHRCLEFARRMRSENHKQDRAQRLIARAWRKYHERRMLIRRKAAALTLAKVFGTFRVRIRIKRKQKAANMLRAFFRTIAAANFLPPLSVNLKQLGQLSQSNTESANQTMINLRKKAQERQALVAKMKMRTGGDRTLVGLIRHFKSQVIVLQRAWRNYIRMREYAVDLHVLLWDSIAASHFSEVYNKMHQHEVSAASQPKAMSAAAQTANMFALSTMNKAPEKSRTFRAQQKVLETAKERDAKLQADAALDAKQADRFGLVPNPTVTTTKKSKIKPLALKMDARFTNIEKRQIILDALKQRKLRFLRVKRHYSQLMQRFVSDQSTGISAARRLLVSDESKFTTPYFQRLFERAHPPPHLPRIMAHRQMIQLMNAASLARKETRTSRYNMAATNLAAALNGASAKSSPQGTPPSSPAAPTRSRAQTVKGYQGREFDLTESRLRETLLKAWAAQLPIPTRPVRLTAEEAAEEKQKRDSEEQENRRRVISFAAESDTDDDEEAE